MSRNQNKRFLILHQQCATKRFRVQTAVCTYCVHRAEMPRMWLARENRMTATCNRYFKVRGWRAIQFSGQESQRNADISFVFNKSSWEQKTIKDTFPLRSNIVTRGQVEWFFFTVYQIRNKWDFEPRWLANGEYVLFAPVDLSRCLCYMWHTTTHTLLQLYSVISENIQRNIY